MEAISQEKVEKNIFNSLLVGLVCIFLVWYLQYHWKRKRFYQAAAQRKGPQPLPLIGNALLFAGNTVDILKNAVKICNQYESVMPVWLGQRLFFGVYDARNLEIIMNSPNALTKEELYKFAEVLVGTGLFTASVPKWKRHRKIIMPTFNQRILDGFVEIFSEQSVILLNQLEKEVGKGTFNIFHYVSRCTLDIICETAMGIRVNAQTTDSDYVKWANAIMETTYQRMFVIWYHYDFIFNRTSMAKELYDIVAKMHNFTGTIVTEKRKAYQKKMEELKDGTEMITQEEQKMRNTFLQQLIELSAQGANFTDEELREEVDTFMVAGSDTTASMNSFMFIMLGMFPDIQEKVYQEVIDVLGHDRQVECKDLGKFHYLERVLKETMRLFPVGPMLVRAVTEDIKLDNFTIPAGCSVVMVILVLHRDPKVWPNPLKFDPDRFLPEEVAKRHPYSWLPFSGGSRNCVGPKYAMMAMKALVATTIRKYKFFTEYKNIEDIALKADLMLKPVNGYKVSIEIRN